MSKRKFIITDEQIKILRPLFPNFDDCLSLEINDFLVKLNDRILYYLDENYNSTEESAILQRVYDEVLDQN